MACHLKIYAGPDPDPAYHFDADPGAEPVFQNDADLCEYGSGSTTLSLAISKSRFSIMEPDLDSHHFGSRPTYVILIRISIALPDPDQHHSAGSGYT